MTSVLSTALAPRAFTLDVERDGDVFARERLLDAVETVFDHPQQLAHARSGQHTLGQAQLRREALARGMGTGGKACSHGPSLPGHARTRTVTRAA